MVKAEQSVTVIEAEYQKCLNAQTIPDNLLVEVKDCLSNMRSALDYGWCKLPGAGKDGHFPITNNANDFAVRVSAVDPKYRTVIEKWQSYQGNEWMSKFGLIRNKNLHVTLVPQKRQETREFTVAGGGASATFRGVTFGQGVNIAVGGIPMKIDQASQFPVDTPGLDIKRTTWVDFLFDGNSISPTFPEGVSALPFIKQSLINVAQIISEIEAA